MINRLTEPSEGRIIFDGQDVTKLQGRALRDWRMRSAMIFQQFNLVQRLDVLTNVLVGRLNQRPMLSSNTSSARRKRWQHKLADVAGADCSVTSCKCYQAMQGKRRSSGHKRLKRSPIPSRAVATTES